MRRVHFLSQAVLYTLDTYDADAKTKICYVHFLLYVLPAIPDLCPTCIESRGCLQYSKRWEGGRYSQEREIYLTNEK